MQRLQFAEVGVATNIWAGRRQDKEKSGDSSGLGLGIGSIEHMNMAAAEDGCGDGPFDRTEVHGRPPQRRGTRAPVRGERECLCVGVRLRFGLSWTAGARDGPRGGMPPLPHPTLAGV
jgi:hypothetical protein